jgi:MFS family permease
MTAIDLASSPLSEADHRAQLRRAVIASTIGSTIGWYDFLLYGQMTVLAFGKLFFPKSDPLVGVLEAFAVYSVGFIARPIGAAIFGHFGDRIGRKGTLIATLMMTGLATFAVGFVPTYARIGIWGAVLLTITASFKASGLVVSGAARCFCRWNGRERTRIAASSPLGRNWAGRPDSFWQIWRCWFSAISGDQFLVWGWRIPFFLSIIMVGVGLYIRLGILETPAFRRLLAENRVERAPALEVIKRQPKLIILTACARMGEQAPGYVYGAFVLTYGTTVLHSSRDFLLMALVIGQALSFFTIPMAGHLSDLIGRKRMYIIGSVATAVFGFVYFPLLNTAAPCWMLLAIVLSFVPFSLMYGPLAAMIAECFPARLRYSGSSIGYQLAAVIAGGPAPLIATALLAAFGSAYVIAAYILFCAIVSIVATALLPDYTNRDISAECA